VLSATDFYGVGIRRNAFLVATPQVSKSVAYPEQRTCKLIFNQIYCLQRPSTTAPITNNFKALGSSDEKHRISGFKGNMSTGRRFDFTEYYWTAGKFMTLDDHQTHPVRSADILDLMRAMTFMVPFWVFVK
jgi:hypothetical protein